MLSACKRDLLLDVIMPIHQDPLDNSASEYQYARSLLDVGDRQRYNRTKPIIEYLQNMARKNKVSLNELLGVVTKQVDYIIQRDTSALGEQLLSGQNSAFLAPETAIFLKHQLNLGRSSYQCLKDVLVNAAVNNRLKFPSWKTVRKVEREVTPAIQRDTSIPGVRFCYSDSLKVTLTQLLSLHATEKTSSQLTVYIKDGDDGSGSHGIYHQQGNEQSHNIIMYMFCVLKIEETDTRKPIFLEPKPASPFAQRPLFLILGKELLNNLADVTKAVEERSVLTAMEVEASGRLFTVSVTAEMSMIDGKMRAMLSGLGGAYCLLCTTDQDTVCGRSALAMDIEACFNINRDYVETRRDFDRLQEGGTVKSRRLDYADRKGLTHEPLLEIDLNQVSPLHSLLRSFDFLLKLVYYQRAGICIWTESQVKLGPSYRHLMNAKEEVRRIAQSATSIPIDAADPTGKSGNVNKGDTCRAYLTKHRNVLVNLVPDRFRVALDELIRRIWICVRVYTSCEPVKVEEYKAFSLDTYKLILTGFDNSDGKTQWINISPTVHSLLAHGWELIMANNSRGLGEYTEQGLENNNKFLRFYRQHLARKNSQSHNLDDCLTRLWLKLDPKIRATAPKPKCNRCTTHGHHTISCPTKMTTNPDPDGDAATTTAEESFWDILISH